MGLPHRANQARLDHFDRTSQTIRSATLITHLGRHFVLFGKVAQNTRFINVMGKRFLAVDVFAHFDGHRSNDGVHVVRSRHIDRIQRFFLFQHLAIIFVNVRLGEILLLSVARGLADIAQGHNIFAGTPLNVARSFASAADTTNVQLVISGKFARRRCESWAGDDSGASGKG